MACRAGLHYGDGVVGLDVPPKGDVDGLYASRRTVLDQAVDDAALEAGATVRGTTVTGLVRTPAGRISDPPRRSHHPGRPTDRRDDDRPSTDTTRRT